MNSLIVVGFDGFAKAVIDSALELEVFESIIVLDGEKIGQSFASAKVVGSIDELQDYYNRGYRSAYIANENNLKWRPDISNKARDLGFSFSTIIDVSARVSPDAIIGNGTYIGKGCVVETCVSIGENTILDAGTIVQSGSSIGNLTRVCTGGVVDHGVRIGDMCYIGVRTVVTEKTVVTDNTEIDDVTVYGKQPF